MRAIIAGGGTGGHIIPGLAIARALQSDYGAEVLFIGTPRGLESKLVPQAGFPLKLVNVGALKGVSAATRLKTVLDLPRAIFAASKMIREFNADVVIGVGGYASGPAMIAAILRGVPTLAFEANRVPGFANKAVAKFVSAAAVHFEETAQNFRNAKVTGVPVRTEFFQAASARAIHNPTILVTGGSQGARAINKAFREAAPELVNRVQNLRIIHQTGERDLADTKAAYQLAGIEAEVSAFVTDMPAAFAKADLILCRAGASTVAEVAAAGKTAIFVPFPFATDDHQKRNAEALVEKNAAIQILESELTPERITNEVSALITGANRLKEMSAAAKALAHPDAAKEIAAMAASLANARKRAGN
jgi:UDP-N-acetylglucosamine--N-acetylmuramyl-(pentapeptide) pyrophosphoryl-undecaprenol N-acetylglucosamine transferase